MHALNREFGRGSLAAAVTAGQPAPWQGKAQHRSLAFTTRLEELLIVS
ncbi:DUF4113 domain-containing protein [Hymenobacter lapidiphilus]|uniref:DUF4113 domain-containing protein n=1 Tax=Hymenobacter lapidiphilus TaxID=2608003 RepID=A0A7Y7PL14_9BACT|nr:DUF4113 domain-containing protein [Hymenobacter lapidiphilus]NVO29702.1 DUF4113 domain-containing protein [Hymenobacter lapidiphilus]